MRREWKPVAELFPPPWGEAVARLLQERGDRVEELRFRVGQVPGWREGGREYPLQVPAGPHREEAAGWGYPPQAPAGPRREEAAGWGYPPQDPAGPHREEAAEWEYPLQGPEGSGWAKSGEQKESLQGPERPRRRGYGGWERPLQFSEVPLDAEDRAPGRETPMRRRGCPPPGIVPVEAGLLEEVVRRASGYAAYSVQDQLRQGFLPLPMGHRLGICGTLSGEGRAMGRFQSLNLRLASQRPGCADGLLKALGPSPGSVLILGPPGAGKTTLLRDLVRLTSDRLGQAVGLVDERGEVAACRDGAPQLAVGRYTDVVTGCRKEAGIRLLLRSMGPAVIAVDEITDPEDLEAMIRASYCGVSFYATAHARDREDLYRRPLYRKLTEAGIFRTAAVLLPDRSLRTLRMDEIKTPISPCKTENPDNTGKPGNTERPCNTEKPCNAERPGKAEDPGNTERPGNTEKSGQDGEAGPGGKAGTGEKNGEVRQSRTEGGDGAWRS